MNKNQIINYWDKRALSFSKDKQAELESKHAQAWIKEINNVTSIQEGMKILDIGTGAGFLAILCAQQGSDVTGIDISSDMIKSAQQNAQHFHQDIQFQIMDAEQLAFEDATFDVVIARNVTWLLSNTQEVYREWLRVLKPNGTLINIDGDYGKDSFEDYSNMPNDHAHLTLGDTMLQESEAIKQSISINQQQRPQYDIEILQSLGLEHVHVDVDVYQRVYRKKDAFYNPTPIFLIAITKAFT